MVKTNKKAWSKEIEILYEEIKSLREELSYYKCVHEQEALRK